MNNIKLVAISHETADLHKRALFHLSETEQAAFTEGVKTIFNLQGLMLLATCNRTEIYFETNIHHTSEILHYFLLFIKNLRATQYVEHDTYYAQYFTCKENTEETLQYLLEVSSGLRSLVIGDMQIISQVKQSFLKAQAQNVQGTILERAIQTAFKMHKRIQNETDFRNGSASTSYLALLAARQKFGTIGLAKKNVLLIGAGEIIKDVAKYSDKFKFQSVTIINRTRETAQKLGQNYGFQVGDWYGLVSAIEAADIIISGVSNQANLVSFTQNLAEMQTSKLFIDLGMPANIDVRLGENPNFTLIDIDNLSTKTEQVATQRQTAINTVRKIIETESKDFFKWLQKVPVNKSLSKLKTHIQDLLEKELSTNFGYLPDTERQKLIQRLSQQLIKQPAITLNQKPDNALATALEMVFDL